MSIVLLIIFLFQIESQTCTFLVSKASINSSYWREKHIEGKRLENLKV